MTVDIKQLRTQLERMDDEGMPSLPWETDDEMGVLCLGGRHCIGELSPQEVADFVVIVVNALPALLDEVERFQSGMMREANRVVELLNENRDLKKELSATKRRVRQLYGALEGAMRIASEYYAFGLEGFEDEYTQIVNQLKDELPEVGG